MGRVGIELVLRERGGARYNEGAGGGYVYKYSCV